MEIDTRKSSGETGTNSRGEIVPKATFTEFGVCFDIGIIEKYTTIDRCIADTILFCNCRPTLHWADQPFNKPHGCHFRCAFFLEAPQADLSPQLTD